MSEVEHINRRKSQVIVWLEMNSRTELNVSNCILVKAIYRNSSYRAFCKGQLWYPSAEYSLSVAAPFLLNMYVMNRSMAKLGTRKNESWKDEVDMAKKCLRCEQKFNWAVDLHSKA